MLLSVLGQELSLHKLNKASLSEKNSYKNAKQTHCSNTDMDQPQQPATFTAENTLKRGNKAAKLRAIDSYKFQHRSH